MANSRSARSFWKNPHNFPNPPAGPWVGSLWLSPGVEAFNLDRVPDNWNDQISAIYNRFDAC